MELTFYQGGDSPEFVRVKKILKDANFRPIGITNDNSIIYSLMYELEYNDGHTASMAPNLIAENLFTQVDQAGNQFTILDSITGKRTDGPQVL